ncbi:BA75_03203T0 [Komagataella pastoris]|uniref:Regulator of rDNA transcription 14 n=1 Tax=Komagataella pastoris TaxID=4922 RepID=A0A1B2JCW9_PICPA|nr:BA75_03203T0 [Komagataella pastoris]
MNKFSSDSSRTTAQSTINKLLVNLVPGSQFNDAKVAKKAKKTSSAKIISDQIGFRREFKMNEEKRRKFLKQNNLKKRKMKRKSKDLEAQLDRIARLSNIKELQQMSEACNDPLLDQVIDKKITALLSWTTDNSELGAEIEKLKRDILNTDNEEIRRRKSYRDEEREEAEFRSEVEKGSIAYPGLTPGLAPVGLSDDEDEDEEDESDGFDKEEEEDQFSE